MSNITKSLTDLEKAADEILSKAAKPEPVDEPKPDEISENPTKADVPEEEKPEETPEEKKDEDEEVIEKCDAPIKKSEEEPEPEVEEEPEETPDKDELEKSIQSDFIGAEDIQKGMDASEFLSSVVEILTKSLADVQYDVQMSGEAHKSANAILVKSLQASIALNKSMADEITQLKAENADIKKSIDNGFETLTSALNEVLSQPAGMRKSLANIQVMDKSFQKSLNGAPSTGIEGLTKSQVMDVLSSELYKGNPNVTTQDIISYESGAPLRPELVSLVSNRK